jgi:putative restriction endonuclease
MGTAPHKPVLLLSILDEINRGHISENQIVLTVELVASFRENWDVFSAGRKGQRVWIPFYYLTGEKFWKLVKNGLELVPKQVGEPNSVNDMQKRVDYAVFAPDLWELLQDKTSRIVLRQHLLQVYFGITPEQV